ncbi:MAG: hypothetical protein V4484_19865 [Pseudomonadota bacterium]
MQTYVEEVDANFRRFFVSLPNDVNATVISLANQDEKYRESYRRLVSLQAWRSELIEKIVPPNAEAFFKEAQNDALMSHSLARQGAWRVALMCLRSCIENTLYGIFYMDHPVELALWQSGVHRLGFSEAVTYTVKHPSFVGISEQHSGLESIKSEYSTLSKAVHGSAQSFRVTKTGEIEGLNVDSVRELNQWAARERSTLIALNTILLTIFRDHLAGAANLNLRKALSLTLPVAKHEQIRNVMGVTLRQVPEPAA